MERLHPVRRRPPQIFAQLPKPKSFLRKKRQAIPPGAATSARPSRLILAVSTKKLRLPDGLLIRTWLRKTSPTQGPDAQRNNIKRRAFWLSFTQDMSTLEAGIWGSEGRAPRGTTLRASKSRIRNPILVHVVCAGSYHAWDGMPARRATGVYAHISCKRVPCTLVLSSVRSKTMHQKTALAMRPCQAVAIRCFMAKRKRR